MDNKFLLNQQQLEQYSTGILVGLSTIVQITSIFVPLQVCLAFLICTVVYVLHYNLEFHGYVQVCSKSQPLFLCNIYHLNLQY